MKLLDNTNTLLGDDLKNTLQPGARLKIAASCFSLYAFEALKTELSKIDSLQFIFTAPTFVAADVTDRLRKERRDFFIPKRGRETSLYGTEFEIHLRNQLTQRAIARECAQWMRAKARFKSNCTKAPMQAFADDNALVACFERGVTEELVKELAGHEPLRVVFRDDGFVSDAVKINVEQIFRQLSPVTEVKSL